MSKTVKGRTTIEYQYDHQGHRISKSKNGKLQWLRFGGLILGYDDIDTESDIRYYMNYVQQGLDEESGLLRFGVRDYSPKYDLDGFI